MTDITEETENVRDVFHLIRDYVLTTVFFFLITLFTGDYEKIPHSSFGRLMMVTAVANIVVALCLFNFVNFTYTVKKLGLSLVIAVIGFFLGGAFN